MKRAVGLMITGLFAGLLALAGCGEVSAFHDAAPPAEVCDDGVDNDGDGDDDCADADCAGASACVENCTDGADNDGDDAIDCADSDCAAECAEVCDDTLDNDGDDAIDCADSDCAGDPACPEICDDGVENDGDDAVDCADADCREATNCVLYAADGMGGVVGNLYVIDPLTAETIQTIPLSIAVTGLAAHPDGTLYATQAVQWGRDSTRVANLHTIDASTGTATPLGPLQIVGGVNHGSIPDITFVGTRLIGWTENGDTPVTIDITNGQVALINGTVNVNSAGSGLATDASGNVFFIDLSVPTGGQLFQVDPVNGTATALGALTSQDTPAIEGAINGMTFLNGVLYGTQKLSGGKGGAGVGSNLVRIDPVARTIVTVGPLPTAIDSIASRAP